jgi:ubiquitin-activating enzyme E1
LLAFVHTGLTPYTRGGVVTQVKMPKTLKFLPLAEAMRSPEYVMTDFAKDNAPETMNVAFQALDRFVDDKKRRPQPWNKADAQTLWNISSQIAAQNDVKISEKMVKIFSYVCAGQLCPVNGFIGGVVAQEVMKSVSGKFHPIFQWMFFDAIECLPHKFNDDGSLETPVDETEFQGSGSRYDGQTAVFGKQFQEVLGRQKYFVVGAGAIGKYMGFPFHFAHMLYGGF